MYTHFFVIKVEKHSRFGDVDSVFTTAHVFFQVRKVPTQSRCYKFCSCQDYWLL